METRKNVLITAVLNSFIAPLQKCSEKEIIGFKSFGGQYFVVDPQCKEALSTIGSLNQSYINDTDLHTSDSN